MRIWRHFLSRYQIWRSVCNIQSTSTYKKHLMVIKMNLTLPTFARQERVKQEVPLSKKQWINIDRVVILLLFAAAITAAVLFS